MQRWAEGEAGVGLWLAVPDSSVAESLGTLDPAYLVVDMQHGLIDYSDVRHLFQATQRSQQHRSSECRGTSQASSARCSMPEPWESFQMVTATSDLLALMAGAKAALAGEGAGSLY